MGHHPNWRELKEPWDAYDLDKEYEKENMHRRSRFKFQKYTDHMKDFNSNQPKTQIRHQCIHHMHSTCTHTIFLASILPQTHQKHDTLIHLNSQMIQELHYAYVLYPPSCPSLPPPAMSLLVIQLINCFCLFVCFFICLFLIKPQNTS